MVVKFHLHLRHVSCTITIVGFMKSSICYAKYFTKKLSKAIYAHRKSVTVMRIEIKSMRLPKKKAGMKIRCPFLFYSFIFVPCSNGSKFCPKT